MKSRRIAFGRTDHFCNFDGIAKTLFCCHRKRTAESGQSLSAVIGRKRYNTLDFAAQNRVPTGCCSHLLDDPEPKGERRPPLETSRIPATPFPRGGQKCFLPVFIFPSVLQKWKCVFSAVGENDRTQLRRVHAEYWFVRNVISKDSAVYGKITYLQIYDVMFLGSSN